MTTLDIKQSHKTVISDILKTNLPSNAKIYVFGSRAKNCAKPHSDLDIGVEIPNEKLTLTTLSKLKSAFEDSTIPYFVDIVDLNNIEDSFKKNIENDLIQF